MATKTVTQTKTVSYSVRQTEPSSFAGIDANIDISRTRTGSSLPDWRKRIKEGVSATTSFTANRQDVKFSPGAANAVFRTASGKLNYVSFTGCVNHSPVLGTPTTDVTRAQNQAIVRFTRDYESNVRKLDGLVALGEMRETIRMIRSPAKSLFSLTKRYLFRARKNAQSRMPKYAKRRVVRDLYLEWTFGAQPLINDIKGAAEAVAEFNLQRASNSRGTARGMGFTEEFLGGTISSSISNQIAGIRYGHVTRRLQDARVIYTGGIGMEANSPAPGSARRLAELSGFDLTQFVPAIWNLLPWSFVYDYFVNIGDILSCSSSATASARWINHTVLKTQIARTSTSVDPGQTAKVWGNNFVACNGTTLGSTIRSRSSVTRSAYGPLVPSLAFEFPPADSLKWLNLAALFAYR